MTSNEFQPLPMELLPPDLSNLPGEFAVVSYVFQSIFLALFLISMITTIAYVQKIVQVFKWHKSDPETYRREATPYVERYKVWNSILGISLSSCALLFTTHAGRVCAGWYLPSQRY